MDLFYSDYVKFRDKTLDNFFNLKILKGDAFSIALKLISANSKILDIGAFNRAFEKFLKEKNCVYKSMDIDKTYFHDYYNLFEVNEKFDFVLMFAVLEHLSLKEIIDYLNKIVSITNTLIIEVPNVFAPSWVFFQDVTHKTMLSPRTLYFLLKKAGFKEINFYRLTNSKIIFLKQIQSKISQHDFCHSILVIAKT